MEVNQARAVVEQLDLINLGCKMVYWLPVAVQTGSHLPHRVLARPLQFVIPLGTRQSLDLELMPRRNGTPACVAGSIPANIKSPSLPAPPLQALCLPVVVVPLAMGLFRALRLQRRLDRVPEWLPLVA